MHCANTGAMTGCAEPQSTVWYSTSANPHRKYRHTLELVRSADGDLIGVNTARANAIVAEALEQGVLPGLPACGAIRREVPIPMSAGERRHGRAQHAGRFDLLADDTYIEVKTVTLKVADSGAFPDAVSVRATRHVEALAALARKGRSTALVFCVLHTGIHAVRPADEIDPAYGAALRSAAAAGVAVLALGCDIGPRMIVPARMLPVNLVPPVPSVADAPL